MQPRKRHTDQWWFEPDLAPKRVKAPSRLKQLDPLDPTLPDFGPRRLSRIGAFAPSNRWLRYNRLQPFDGGYIVPLYSITDIARRYGLSRAGTRYFKSHILPEPFGIVRRRATQAHHYSKFVLMTLDVVLKDLEDRGYSQFLRTFEDHVQLLHTGVAWMSSYYEQKAEMDAINSEDRHGVIWYQR